MNVVGSVESMGEEMIDHDIIETEARDTRLESAIINDWEEIIRWTLGIGLGAWVVNIIIMVIVHFHMQAQKHKSDASPNYHIVGLHWYFFLPAMLIAALACLFSYIEQNVANGIRYPRKARGYVILCCLLSPITFAVCFSIWLANRFFQLVIVRYRTAKDQIEFKRSFRGQSFASELKELYAQEKQLAGMSRSFESEEALKFVRTSINNIKKVPVKIRQDEDRIKAMNIVERAKELCIGPETHLEAHKELMAEYHEPMLKQQLEKLNIQPAIAMKPEYGEYGKKLQREEVRRAQVTSLKVKYHSEELCGRTGEASKSCYCIREEFS